MNSQLMMPMTGLARPDDFDIVYTNIIQNTLSLIGNDDVSISAEVNKRTGTICHTLTSAVALSFDLSDRLPMPTIRKFYPKTAAAEAAWFIKGTQDSRWIQKYCPIWDDFTEDDGKTVKAAYGYRWRKHFGRDQLADLISGLFVNPSDRRTVLCAWDPGDDGLMNHGTKNVPCPFAMSFYIVDGKLMLSYYIRSSDMYVGLPYDIMCTALVADAIAAELRQRAIQTLCAYKPTQVIPEADSERLSMLATLGLGSLSTMLGNPHMYDNHVSLAEDALKEHRNTSSDRMKQRKAGLHFAPKLPGWSVSDIEDNPDAYVQHVANLFQDCIKSTCSQRPDVAV